MSGKHPILMIYYTYNMDENFDTLVAEASHILENQENYQWSLGELANNVVQSYGYKALEDFAKKIQETSGVWRSPGSLRMYAFVWRQSVKLGIPKDLLFSTCQAIVFSDNPQKYIDMAGTGASRVDIRNQIYTDKHNAGN